MRGGGRSTKDLGSMEHHSKFETLVCESKSFQLPATWPSSSLMSPKMYPQGDEPSTVQVHALSCVMCRSKKNRCDRVLPRCSTCVAAQRSCSYPQKIQKPGPKPGRSYPRPWAKSTSPQSDEETNSKERASRTRARRQRNQTRKLSCGPDLKPSSTQAKDIRKISFLFHPSHNSISSTGTETPSLIDVELRGSEIVLLSVSEFLCSTPAAIEQM